MREFALSTKKDEIFEITVHSSGSSGYVWKVTNLPDGIELIDRKVYSGDDAQSAGNASRDVFSFRGSRTGTFDLQFGLSRQWEQKSIDELIYKVTVM